MVDRSNIASSDAITLDSTTRKKHLFEDQPVGQVDRDSMRIQNTKHENLIAGPRPHPQATVLAGRLQNLGVLAFRGF